MHFRFWVTSKLAQQPFAELHHINTAWFTAVLLGVCGGISYFTQNIHRHISEQLCIKARVRVGWLMCRTDKWLRVVSQHGQANPTLCVPLMRAYNVFRHMKDLFPNHFNPKKVILVQLHNPTHHMLYLTTACMDCLLFGLWFYIWHSSVSLVGALCAD